MYFNFLAAIRHIKWLILCVFILYSPVHRIQRRILHVSVFYTSNVLYKTVHSEYVRLIFMFPTSNVVPYVPQILVYYVHIFFIWLTSNMLYLCKVHGPPNHNADVIYLIWYFNLHEIIFLQKKIALHVRCNLLPPVRNFAAQILFTNAKNSSTHASQSARCCCW